MDAQQHEKMVASLSKTLQERETARDRLAHNLRVFSEHLFAAIEAVISEARTQGVPGLGKPRRLVHPAGGGREGLQIFIEDWSIIFVPLWGFARPNAADEARIPSVQFKEQCARIAVFLTDDPQGHAFYDFLIFQDGAWFAWGYGWPKQQSDIESTDFEALALELVHSFVKDIFVTWHVRGQTMLSDSLEAKKRTYYFGLPGEERQGM